MWFTNKGGPVKIRIGEPSDCYWATIRKGESVELSADMGKHYGFSIKTTEGQIGNNKVETKQIDVPQCPVNVPKNYTVDFLKELNSIKGIGKKTAEDIMKIFPVREELIKTIRASTDANALPFRENTCDVLWEAYNG